MTKLHSLPLLWYHTSEEGKLHGISLIFRTGLKITDGVVVGKMVLTGIVLVTPVRMVSLLHNNL